MIKFTTEENPHLIEKERQAKKDKLQWFVFVEIGSLIPTITNRLCLGIIYSRNEREASAEARRKFPQYLGKMLLESW